MRILIADDHPVVRRGIRSALQHRADWDVCGEAGDGKVAVELAAALRPEAAVLDVSMPELNGLEATRQIVAIVPGTSVLLFAEEGGGALADEAVAAGARGVVLKRNPTEELLVALDTILRGGTFFSRELTVVRRNRGPRNAAGLFPLTPRERQILQLIAEGRRTREIGDLLGISERTVETHRGALMRKLHLSSLAEVVRYAIRNNLTDP